MLFMAQSSQVEHWLAKPASTELPSLPGPIGPAFRTDSVITCLQISYSRP
jgi:hypothetical protein